MALALKQGCMDSAPKEKTRQSEAGWSKEHEQGNKLSEVERSKSRWGRSEYQSLTGERQLLEECTLQGRRTLQEPPARSSDGKV